MVASALMGLPGVIATEEPGSPDAGVPAHLGNPLREQSRLAEGEALVALPGEVVCVSGPDRLGWLTTLSSQILTDLGPDHEGKETLLLDAQGHITHALAVLDDGETAYLVAESGRGEALAQFLDSMRFMLRVEVSQRPDLVALGAHGVGRDRLAAAVESLDLPLLTWCDPWPGVVEGGTAYDVGLAPEGSEFRHPGAHYEGGFVLVPAGREREVLARFATDGREAADQGEAPASDICAHVAGMLAWEALRVEAGRPRQAREVDERTIPHELDWLRTAVHLTKGCYPGQETIARTLNLGRPPRRLTVLQLDGLGGDMPQPGATVRLGERAVGTLTSVARHHELGPVGLALLRRNLPVDQPLTVALVGEENGDIVEVGRVDAAQEPLVSPEGKAEASPAERPGAGLRTSLLHGSR